MPKLSQLSHSDAKALLDSYVPSWFNEVIDFVNGEQFGPSGEYWMGPTLDERISTSQDVLDNIKDGFVFSNKVEEVVSRHLDALITEEPELTYVPVEHRDEGPTPEEEFLIEAANDLRDQFFVDNDVYTIIEQFGRSLLSCSRASIRLYVPPGQLEAYDENGVEVEYDDPNVAYYLFPQVEIDDALNRLSIHHPDPRDSIVLTDDKTSTKICLYRYKETSVLADNVRQPISTRNSEQIRNSTGTERIEVCFLVRDAKEREITVIKVLTAKSEGFNEISKIIDVIKGNPVEGDGTEEPVVRKLNPDSSALSGQDVGFTFDMGGDVTMFEGYRTRFVTDSMIKAQRALNLSLTMIPRNITLAGFLERVITNGMPPGHFENGTYDANGNFTQSDNGKALRFVPDMHTIGPSTLNFYSGIKTTDPDGKVHLTTPGVHYKDPISPQHIVDSKQACYTTILEEARQLHVLQAADGSLSGVSRVQARAEFNNSLSSTVRVFNSMLEWLCMVPLKMAATLSGNPRMFDAIKPSVKVRVNLGPLTTDERAAIIEQHKAGLLSRETSLRLLGSRDVEAEVSRIGEETSTRLDTVQKQVEVATIMIESGVDPEKVAELVGLDVEIVENLFGPSNPIDEPLIQ